MNARCLSLRILDFPFDIKFPELYSGFVPRKPEIQREREMRLEFLDEIRGIPGGEKIVDCIQCGVCSGSCPTGFLMEHAPRKLFSMIRAGLRDEVLKSSDIWLCTSCYHCYVRCPQNIKVTDIMYVLKRLAAREKNSLAKKGLILSKAFMKTVNKYGYNHEPELLFKFFGAADKMAFIKNAMVGLRLFLHGRLPIFPKRIKNIGQFKAVVAKARALQGD